VTALDKSPAELAALYTPEVRTVLDSLATYMREREISRKGAARMLGCDPSNVGRLLRHVYGGDVAGLVARIKQVLEREHQRHRVPHDPPHAEIGTTEMVHRTMQIAHLERRIAAILGGTGVGKSVAAQEYARRNDHVAYLVAGCTGSKGTLARRIAEALHVAPSYRMDRTVDRIIQAARGTDWLLVIDEMDEVPPDSLRLIREIHDAAQIGIVVIGTEAFLEALRAKASRVINQFLGRVAYVEHVQPLGRDAVEAIAAPYGLDPEALDVLTETAHGQARRVAMLLVNAQRAGGQHLTAKAIRKARAELMPVLNGNGGSH